jgi:hypothetical protein
LLADTGSNQVDKRDGDRNRETAFGVGASPAVEALTDLT